MANVMLRKMWFAPGGQRWREGQYLDFPEQLLEFLPKDSVINDGSGPKRAEDWRGDRKGKKDTDLIEATKTFTPNTNVDSVTALPDPGDPKHNTGPSGDDPKAAAGQGESESPASPKSSGPDTTALPGTNKEGQATTASGTTPAQKAAQAAADAAAKK